MKVRIYTDEMYPVYYKSEWDYGSEIEVPQAVWEEWEEVSLKWHQFQNMFSDLYVEAIKAEELLSSKSKDAKQPVGFN